MSRPPFDLVTIEAGTPIAMASGHRIFQTHRYAADDQAHVDKLLEVMAPAQSATVLDAGCGIGEVARLMAVRRPDLRFILVNLSPTQLAHCPQGDRFKVLCADYHNLPLPDACVDAVMFSSALSQMDEEHALPEAFRVMRRDAVLLVNEPVRIGGDGAELENLLACRTHRIRCHLAGHRTRWHPRRPS